MAKIFTKLNIGDTVATSGTRVFKKLSTEEPAPPLPIWDGADLTGTTWHIRNNYTPAGYGVYSINGSHWSTPASEDSAKSFNRIRLGYINRNDKETAEENNVRYEMSSTGYSYNYGALSHYVKFTGGSSVKSSSLIRWLNTYGTIISHRDPRQTMWFHLAGTAPAADKNATWETWIASSYNMEGVSIQPMTFEGRTFNAILIYHICEGRYTIVKHPDGSLVDAKDKIAASKAYSTIDLTDDAYTKYTGTWVFNDVLSRPSVSYLTCKFAFTHGYWSSLADGTATEGYTGMAIGTSRWSGNYSLWYTDNNFDGFPIEYSEAGIDEAYIFVYDDRDEPGKYNDTWDYGGEKTITILSDPTNETFIAWLKANARRVTTIVTPGLYDADNNLVASWYNLTRIYGMDVEKNYAYSDNNTDLTSPYHVLTNNSDLAAGTKLIIPESVTVIGKMAFYGCDNLTSITIPSSVAAIDIGAFNNCRNLTDVHYSGTEEQWAAIYIGDYNTGLLNSTIHYNWSTDPEPGNYISFSSRSDFAVGVLYNGKQWNGTIEYSPDATDWKIWSGAYPISSNKGRLYLRGVGNTRFTGAPDGGLCGALQLTGMNISCNGNIENLLDYQTVANGGHPGMSARCFEHMFVDCTNLVEAPELCATTLSNNCYYGMFRRCTGLTVAPALPASELTEYCYYDMFEDCSGIRMIDLTGVITLSEGIQCISSSYDQVLRFGTNLKTITSGNVFVHPDSNRQHQISIRYEFTDDDTPEFNTSYVVSPGRGKGGASYRIYTDNTAIKDGALSVADESTTVIVYHLNGEVWV